MNSSIFIPKTINVGFQNRSDTYTKKLAYIIYYDEKGKLRKETSWNGWRDSKIANEEFENAPTSGFVLNKKVGDYNSGWNHRSAYCRVYDPRNFEFEITIENLLYILENTNSIKGKGLEGEFVYGWDGKDLVLIPTDSPDYKEINSYNELLHNKQSFKGKDLIIGATYRTKGNGNLIYIGRFDKWDEKVSYYRYSDRYSSRSSGWDEEIDDTWHINGNRASKHINKGKHYFFYSEKGGFTTFKSVGNVLIDIVDDRCISNYADTFDKLECRTIYSPLDESKHEIHHMDINKFIQSTSRINNWNYKYFMGEDGVKYKISKFYDSNAKKYLDDQYVCHAPKIIKDNWGKETMEHSKIPDGFSTKVIKVTDGWRGNLIDKTIEEPVTIEDIFNILKPVYRKCYLANGKFYKEEITW